MKDSICLDLKLFDGTEVTKVQIINGVMIALSESKKMKMWKVEQDKDLNLNS